MDYKIYRLEFQNGVHFGHGNLDSTDFIFRADTLFSALFQEALRIKKEQEFLTGVSSGKIVLSDAFPYIGRCYYIPKPMVSINLADEKKQGDSKQKKLFKNLKYIPVNNLCDFVNGTFPEEHMEDMKYLGKYGMKTSVGIRGMEEPQPYRVSTFYFNEGTGLYILAGYEGTDSLELLEELWNCLQYTGLGGKKSSGLGRFRYEVCDLSPLLKDQIVKNSDMNLLLSTALPEDEELEHILEDASYTLLRRGGFIDSQTYAPQQMRKQELYVFSSGSCFRYTFKGRIIEERNGGSHSIFRYAKAFFMGV